jgi:hypothetical protein
MNESEATRKLCAELKTFNATCLSFTGSQFQRAGIPDRFIAHSTLPGGAWVEFKVNDNMCSAAQRLMLAELQKRGCQALVARHPSEGWAGAIENEDGDWLDNWDGSARDLLRILLTLRS